MIVYLPDASGSRNWPRSFVIVPLFDAPAIRTVAARNGLLFEASTTVPEMVCSVCANEKEKGIRSIKPKRAISMIFLERFYGVNRRMFRLSVVGCRESFLYWGVRQSLMNGLLSEGLERTRLGHFSFTISRIFSCRIDDWLVKM